MSAVPADRIVGCASGGVIAAGRHRFSHNALLDLIADAPNASWLQANTNTFQSQWPADDYLPMFGAGPGDPQAIIRAWSGFGWDSKNHRLVIFGGGHANYSGNDTYIWDAVTRQWTLAFYPSDVKTNSTGHETVDGPLHSPIASHTYCNNNYLPLLDRFITFGGAAHSSGGPFLITDGGGATLRMLPGGYTCNLAQAGQGKVGGLTGSNVKRGSSLGVDLAGANAWYPRDWLLDHPQAALAANLTRHVNFFTIYHEEDGKDVLYVGASSGGTTPHLFRVQYNDADNYLTDSITHVGQAWSNTGVDTGAAFDPVNNTVIYLGSGTYPIYGWDLDYASATNHNFRVAPAGITGPDAAEWLANGVADMGLLYDPIRGYFVSWDRGGRVWSIEVPVGDPIPESGWVVTKIKDTAVGETRPATALELGYGQVPENDQEMDRGVCGKWKYAPDMDCYIALQGSFSGNIWLYKPIGWQDPRNG